MWREHDMLQQCDCSHASRSAEFASRVARDALLALALTVIYGFTKT
jgi:hypothetical protein